MLKAKYPSKDMNQLAKRIVDLATGSVDKNTPKVSKKSKKSANGKK
jgi:hypothetical protein